MANQTGFHLIDLETWPMAQSYYYYSTVAPTSYTVNLSFHVSTLRKALKEKGYRFFPAYLYLVTKALSEQHAFSIAKQSDALGYWDYLTPLYPILHEETKTTSLLWTAFHTSFQQFHEQYLQDKKRYPAQHGILTAKGTPPANAYVISCIPWLL